MAKPIYLVGGGKGGVGKSMVTMALMDDLQQRDQTMLLVETDTTNPDVWMCYRDEVETATLDLDEVDGWIALINRCESQPDHTVIVNTAARNNHGVSVHGVTLNSTLVDLQRRLVTLWVINRQRDSLELLKPFQEALSNAVVHVVRNLYFGESAKFELYNHSRLRETLERAGGRTLDFPDLADRVSDDLFGQRLSIARAARDLPLGNRAELTRWRNACARMFAHLPESADVPGPA